MAFTSSFDSDGFPHLLMWSLTSLLCRSYSVVWLSLRRNCSKYRCAFGVFMRGNELCILLSCHLGLAFYTFILHPTPHSSALAITNTFPIPMILSFWECYINGAILCVTSWDWLFFHSVSWKIFLNSPVCWVPCQKLGTKKSNPSLLNLLVCLITGGKMFPNWKRRDHFPGVKLPPFTLAYVFNPFYSSSQTSSILLLSSLWRGYVTEKNLRWQYFNLNSSTNTKLPFITMVAREP